jgi:opacity protein-like surface antigen
MIRKMIRVLEQGIPIYHRWGGVGYNNGNGRVHDIGDSHLAGLLQIGMGTYIRIAKRWWLRGEYRFQHISDPFYHGDGINTHTFVMGVSF